MSEQLPPIPAPQPTPPKKDKPRDPIYVTIIILLMIGGGLLFMQYNDANKKISECNDQNAALSKERDQLMLAMDQLGSGNSEEFLGDLSKLLTNYDTLISISTNLKEDKSNLLDSLESKRQRILELQDEVKRGKWTAGELFRKKKELEVLRSVMQDYVKRIDSLTTQNAELSLRLNKAQDHIEEQDKTIVQYEKKTNTLEEKVAAGSVLTAAEMSAYGIRLRSNGDQRETDRAKRTNRVKACFKVMQNSIAKSGTKTLYLRVIEPGGAVSSPGGLSFKAGGTEVEYSVKRDIDYQNQDLEVCIYYIFSNTPPPEGTFKVEVWCEGHKIGNTTMDLK